MSVAGSSLITSTKTKGRAVGDEVAAADAAEGLVGPEGRVPDGGKTARMTADPSGQEAMAGVAMCIAEPSGPRGGRVDAAGINTPEPVATMAMRG